MAVGVEVAMAVACPGAVDSLAWVMEGRMEAVGGAKGKEKVAAEVVRAREEWEWEEVEAGVAVAAGEGLEMEIGATVAEAALALVMAWVGMAVGKVEAVGMVRREVGCLG